MAVYPAVSVVSLLDAHRVSMVVENLNGRRQLVRIDPDHACHACLLHSSNR
jgi:hypothetical protein